MTEAEKRKYRVCFTGHRPEKLTRHECQVIRGLEAAIKKAIADGYKVFISGMAPGVDIWAAEIVLQLRDKGADIKLICAIPFEGFEKRWPEWEGRYNAIMEKADLVRFICKGNIRGVHQIRNVWMVDHSARVIAVFNGEKSGTKNTIDYANRVGVEIEYIPG